MERRLMENHLVVAAYYAIEKAKKEAAERAASETADATERKAA